MPAARTMELFISAVRQYPCLWNTAAIEYRDQELKDAAWAEVTRETDLASVKEVKLKWKKLRDSYRDALKRQSEMLARGGRGGGGDPHPPGKRNYAWKYMGLMQFLQPHMNNRKKPAESPPTPAHPPPDLRPRANGGGGGGGGGGGEHSSDESESDAEEAPKRSLQQLSAIDRKLDFLCEAQAQAKRPRASPPPRREPPPSVPAPDPLDVFFNSMCQSTKRLPYPTQIKIKKILFGAVVEAEEALLAEQANYASLWAAEAGSSSSSEPADEEAKPS